MRWKGGYSFFHIVYKKKNHMVEHIDMKRKKKHTERAGDADSDVSSLIRQIPQLSPTRKKYQVPWLSLSSPIRRMPLSSAIRRC